MARSYNKAQTQVINDGWYAVQRMIEKSQRMETRLALCLKEQRRHFPLTASRSHILHHIREGLRMSYMAEAVEVSKLKRVASDDLEYVLAVAIGIHYSDHADALAVMVKLSDVAKAEAEAQQAFHDSI